MALTRRQWLTGVLLALFVAGWIVLLVAVSPTEIVAAMGVESSYLVVLLLSILGSLGSVTTFSSYPAIVTLAAGGMNPLALGIVSGIGLTIGDTIFYLLFRRLKGLLSGKPRAKAEALRQWLDARPGWTIPLVVYVWVGLLPLANNILTGALAITGYAFWKVLTPLLLGNITFPTGVAYLAYYGIELT